MLLLLLLLVTLQNARAPPTLPFPPLFLPFPSFRGEGGKMEGEEGKGRESMDVVT